MKKLLLSTLLLGAVTTAAVADDNTITFGTEPQYKPFEFKNDKNEIVGFDIDLAKALCAELNKTCAFKDQAFDSLIQSLKFKQFDAIISGMDVTDARKKIVDFVGPYLENSAAFVGKSGESSLETAKTVGVQNGTTFQKYLKAKAPQYTLKPYKDIQQAVLDLKNGRIDLVFSDTPVLEDWLKTEKGLGFVGDKVVDTEFFGVGYGIAVNKDNKALTEELSKALKAIKEKGLVDELYKKWIK